MSVRYPSDNVVNCIPDALQYRSKTNVSKEKFQLPVSVSAITGNLSQRIEANLKTSMNFYVNKAVDNTSEIVDISGSHCRETDLKASTDSYVHSIITNVKNVSKIFCAHHRCDGKSTLDKYFNVTKSQWRTGISNVNKFVTKSKGKDFVNIPIDNGDNDRRLQHL